MTHVSVDHVLRALPWACAQLSPAWPGEDRPYVLPLAIRFTRRACDGQRSFGVSPDLELPTCPDCAMLVDVAEQLR